MSTNDFSLGVIKTPEDSQALLVYINKGNKRIYWRLNMLADD